MTKGIRICAHLELRVPDGERNVAISVSAANCINSCAFRYDHADFPCFCNFDVVINRKCKTAISEITVSAFRGLSESHRRFARDLAKVVFLDFDLDRVHSAANGSDEVPPFIGHDFLCEIGNGYEHFAVVRFVNRHRFANRIDLCLRTGKQDFRWWERSGVASDSPRNADSQPQRNEALLTRVYRECFVGPKADNVVVSGCQNGRA